MNSILLQAAAGGSSMSGLLMIVAMIVIFYFFMIRPQQKQKEIKKAREAMKSGDRVVTAGGIHGKLKDIAETTVMIEVAPGVQIKVDKASVFPDGENPNKQQ